MSEKTIYVVCLEWLVNILMFLEMFFSISNTEYYYPYNFNINYNGMSCNFGDLLSDCFADACQALNLTNYIPVNFTGPCEIKNYISFSTTQQIALIFSGLFIVLSTTTFIYQICVLSKGNLKKQTERLMTYLQLTFAIISLALFIGIKSLEIAHIAVKGLKLAELVEFLILSFALLFEIVIQIYEIYVMGNIERSKSALDLDDVDRLSLRTINEDVLQAVQRYALKVKHSAGVTGYLHGVHIDNMSFEYHLILYLVANGISLGKLKEQFGRQFHREVDYRDFADSDTRTRQNENEAIPERPAWDKWSI